MKSEPPEGRKEIEDNLTKQNKIKQSRACETTKRKFDSAKSRYERLTQRYIYIIRYNQNSAMLY